MILEFQCINGTYIPYSTQCKNWSDKQTDRAIVKLKVADTDVGSYSMLKTWKMWAKEMAAYMQHQKRTVPMYYDSDDLPHGQRPFDENDAHAVMTAQFLGLDEKGNRYSWRLDSDGGVTVAPKELRLLAMDRFVMWAAENEVFITIPRCKDYDDFKESQIEDSPNTKYTTVGEEE